MTKSRSEFQNNNPDIRTEELAACRREFEAWLSSHAEHLDMTYIDGAYTDWQTFRIWYGWQALWYRMRPQYIGYLNKIAEHAGEPEMVYKITKEAIADLGCQKTQASKVPEPSPALLSALVLLTGEGSV